MVNRRALYLLILLGVLPTTFCAAEVSIGEYDIKAGYLLHLGKFIHWPDNTFPTKTSPFSICIIGNAPFSDVMVEAMNKKVVKQRKMQVGRYNSTKTLPESCQILFISRSEESRVKTILDWARPQPILTVSDISNFARLGGMIEMSTKNARITFTIDLPASRQKNIDISSDLLALATVIH